MWGANRVWKLVFEMYWTLNLNWSFTITVLVLKFAKWWLTHGSPKLKIISNVLVFFTQNITWTFLSHIVATIVKTIVVKISFYFWFLTASCPLASCFINSIKHLDPLLLKGKPVCYQKHWSAVSMNQHVTGPMPLVFCSSSK